MRYLRNLSYFCLHHFMHKQRERETETERQKETETERDREPQEQNPPLAFYYVEDKGNLLIMNQKLIMSNSQL